MRWAMWEDVLLGVIVLGVFGLGCVFMEEAVRLRAKSAERDANHQKDCVCTCE